MPQRTSSLQPNSERKQITVVTKNIFQHYSMVPGNKLNLAQLYYVRIPCIISLMLGILPPTIDELVRCNCGGCTIFYCLSVTPLYLNSSNKTTIANYVYWCYTIVSTSIITTNTNRQISIMLPSWPAFPIKASIILNIDNSVSCPSSSYLD